ncbi:MAG: nucleotide sugar dehydrogenase [Firmicutes bacterium]|nr:nucleotide sugar dehydrogenase [Bacillota bacterium]
METVAHVIDTSDQYASDLLEKIKAHTARVAVIGIGYVGLPLAVEKVKVGFSVVGIDQNPLRVAQINRGENYIRDVHDDELRQLVDAGKLRATDDFDVLHDCDVVVVCVPTPLTKNREPDISYITAVTEQIAQRLHRGMLVTIESTTYPGTTQEQVLPRLEKTGLKVGEDFFLAFSPERVDPGNQRYTTHNTSKVVGGVTPTCLEIAYTFYSQTILNVVPVSSPAVAEMTKVFENTYRAVNIALVNELMLLCDKMHLDVWEVVEAAGTKPFGIQTFWPGPGVGGHCIPIDPFYLTWKAREFDFHTRFIELAGELNVEVSYYVVDKVIEALNRQKKAMNGAKVLVLGVAYKKDLPDIRESPALRILPQLIEKGAVLSYHDPYIPEIEPRELPVFAAKSVELTAEALESADCVLILTDHSNVDYDFVVEHAKTVVDTRNACKNVREHRKKILKI